jgi:hypothetical protein
VKEHDRSGPDTPRQVCVDQASDLESRRRHGSRGDLLRHDLGRNSSPSDSDASVERELPVRGPPFNDIGAALAGTLKGMIAAERAGRRHETEHHLAEAERLIARIRIDRSAQSEARSWLVTTAADVSLAILDEGQRDRCVRSPNAAPAEVATRRDRG